MLMKQGFMVLGTTKITSPEPNIAISDDHEQLLRRFGPGEFLGYYDLLPMSYTQTLAEQIPEAAQSPYGTSLVFATSSRGEIFIQTAGDTSKIVVVRDPYALADPSATMAIGKCMDDWLRAICTSAFAPPGLVVPYFIPSQPVEAMAERAALSPGSDQRAAFDVLRDQVLGAGGVILVYRNEQPAARMVAWFDAAMTLVTFEVGEPEKTLAAFDASVFTKQFAGGHVLGLEPLASAAGWDIA